MTTEASKPRARRSRVPKLRSGDPGVEAKRTSSAILEVLAGQRTPLDAAEALGITLPRYYALEARALEGFLAALKPRARGRRRSAEREQEVLRLEVERLEREGARLRALLRAAERTLGLKPPEPPKKEPGKKRRRRRPTARALKAVEAIRALPGENPVDGKPTKEHPVRAGGGGDHPPRVGSA